MSKTRIVAANQIGTFRVGGSPAWRPYADTSPWNKPIPAGASAHANSAAIIAKITGWGDPQERYCGVASSTVSGDYDHPVYFSNANDPLYQVQQAADGYDSDYWDTYIRMPDSVRAAKSSDSHLTVIDFYNGNEWDIWKAAYALPNHQIPAGGGPFEARGLGLVRIFGSGLNIGTGDADAARMGLHGGHVRYEELLARNITHALSIVVKSTDGTHVAPATGNAGSVDPTNAPPCGARMQLMMTDSEIDALSTTWWNKVMLKALAHYGGYIRDTSGSGSWYFQLESGQSYLSMLNVDPWRTFGQNNSLYYWAGGDVYTWEMPTGITWANELRILDWTDPNNY